MALRFPINMDLGLFKGNGAMALAPLDIRVICFARLFAHNTLCEIWNSSTFNWIVTSLSLEETQACSFSKSSIIYPLFIRNFCIPKSFSKFLKSSFNFSTNSLDFSTVVRLVQALKLWDCVFALETSHCFFANFASISMRLDFSSSNCFFLSRNFKKSLMASFSNFSFQIVKHFFWVLLIA